MKYFLLSLASIIILASCQQTPTAPQTREDILRSGKWKITSGTVEYKFPYDSTKAVDTFGFIFLKCHKNKQHLDTTAANILLVMDTCHTDDYIVFGLNNNANYFNGPMTCSIADPDSVGFTWYLSNGGNTITFANANNAFANNNVVANITSFSNNSFTISYNSVYTYIDSPLSLNAIPVYHDTTWSYDTVHYNITYGH